MPRQRLSADMCLEAGVASVVLTEYKVKVYTGNRDDAGTDADVYITLYGDSGHCGETSLDLSWHDDFEAGSCVSFHLLNI